MNADSPDTRDRAVVRQRLRDREEIGLLDLRKIGVGDK